MGTHTSTASSSPSLELIQAKQAVDIIREDPDENRRLVYLQFTNKSGVTYTNPVFTYTDNGETVSRQLATLCSDCELLYDTVWVSCDTESIMGSIMDEDGNVFWHGTVTIEKAAREHVIRHSKVYTLDEIPPASLRGVNYYPRWTPWSAWTKQDPAVWDAEFREIMGMLPINIIRTFAELWEEDLYPGWCPKTEYLVTISTLFGAAEQYGIKVLFCLHSALPSKVQGENVRYVRGIIEPFVNDGRVFGWDLVNEIDDKGLAKLDYVNDFCREFNVRMSEFDPNHPSTIGFAYMLEKPGMAGLNFDGAQQFWQYHWYRHFTADTVVWIANQFFNGRPFLIGECGDTSLVGASDAPRSYTGEEWQLSVYKSVIPAVLGAAERGYDIKGMLAWIAFDFPSMAGQQPSGQGEYGLIRADGTPKPAAEFLAGEFAKMKQSRPAPWD